MYNNELRHYGVLGMRWGRRKAKQYSDKASKARKAGDTYRAEKYQSRATNAKQYAKRNEKQTAMIAKRTMGSKIAMNIWAGPFANRTYNSVRASGGSKGSAFAITTATAILGGPIGHIAVAELYGHGVFGDNKK